MPTDARDFPNSVRTMADVAQIDRLARRVEIPGAEGAMVWRSWGSGRPVVLLHGGSGSWKHWVRNIGALVAAQRQVWACDLPGFGESARVPGARDADRLPEPVESALQALLGDTAADLVGFSFGAMVAGLIAARRPARARCLVLVGAPALGIEPVSRIVLRPWRHLAPGAERDAAHRDNLARLMLSGPGAVDELALALHAADLARDRMRQRRVSRTDILRRTLADVRCPVHGIWGSEDALYHGALDGLAPALARAPAFRGLELVAGAGHWVQFECAAQFDRALARALAPG